MKSLVSNPTQAYILDQHTVVAPPALWHAEDDGIRCIACGHRCLIKEGRRGICKVRTNEAGELRVPWGYVGALQCDPVEKKPFFHVEPSSDALTFGMLGCDYHCSYCQNWFTSQALRDASSTAAPQPVSPQQLVGLAQRERARLVVSSYNEPLITAEWAVAVFAEARQAGLLCAFVSNGNGTPEAIEHLAPWIDAYKVDLKGFDDRHYRTLGGTLGAVLETIQDLHSRGIWLEIVTLLIPGFNDSDDEIRRLTAFVASVGVDIPWHVTAFHSDYKMRETPDTDTYGLICAAELGREAGLKYVYAGNRPGQVGGRENTYCPGCGETLIERIGYVVRDYRIAGDGTCPKCATAIPGRWPTSPESVRLGDGSVMRLPRRV